MSAAFPMPRLHQAGHVIIAIAMAVTLLAFMLSACLGFISLLPLSFCVYFFRDPDRMVPQGEGLMVAPADGRVIAVQDVVPPPELELGDEARTRVTIFLSVFNVHVNRIAATGRVRKKIYNPGKFLHAAADKASADNERLSLVIDLPEPGKDYAQIQIAGLIARRIICDATQGQEVQTGVRYGIIRFGSRADIYLPSGATAQVAVGQTMIGGETVLADWRTPQPARTGIMQ